MLAPVIKPRRPRRPRRQPRLRGRLPAIFAALAGVGVFVVATDGGRHPREAQHFVAAIDQAAAALGMGLTEIRVAGHQQTNDRDVFEALKLANVQSILGFDAQAARARIEQLPWVRSATIQRSFPDAVNVTIAERVAFAVWENAGRRVLIDGSGRQLGPAPATAVELPVVAGEGAAREAAKLFSMLGEHPRLRQRVVVAQRIEGRRWSLVLDGGSIVHLPAAAEEDALWRLTMARAGGSLLERDVGVVDLRSPAHVVLLPKASASVAGGLAVIGRGVAAGGTRGGGPETRSE